MGKPTDRLTAAADSGAVDEESRAGRFMRSALAILGETGRTDFTVLEVVERSKTSLRSFYQHFTTKDELLLALIDKIMAESTLNWREATDGLDATTALRLLVERISAPASTSTQDSINSCVSHPHRPSGRSGAVAVPTW
jgi:AcrR family transcriptional regulator